MKKHCTILYFEVDFTKTESDFNNVRIISVVRDENDVFKLDSDHKLIKSSLDGNRIYEQLAPATLDYLISSNKFPYKYFTIDPETLIISGVEDLMVEFMRKI